MILVGPEAEARLAREKAVALHAFEFDVATRSLTIYVDGTRMDDEETAPQTGLPDLDAVLSSTREIVVRPGCRRYTVVFDTVVMFACHDESYHVPSEDGSAARRGPFEQFTASRYLDYARAESVAETILEDPLLHFRLSTLDDILDIATTQAPSIRSRTLTPAELWLDTD